MTIKQIIVVRTDLNMSPGKMAAQVAHAAMANLLDAMQVYSDKDGNITGRVLRYTDSPNDQELKDWVEGSFTKIVVSVKSEKKLLELYDKVQKAGLRVSLITDNGSTEFNGVPTNTCIAIGPHSAERIDPLTKKYPLLNQ